MIVFINQQLINATWSGPPPGHTLCVRPFLIEDIGNHLELTYGRVDGQLEMERGQTLDCLQAVPEPRLPHVAPVLVVHAHQFVVLEDQFQPLRQLLATEIE